MNATFAYRLARLELAMEGAKIATSHPDAVECLEMAERLIALAEHIQEGATK